MNPVRLRRHEITVLPETARVIIRPFIPSNVHLIAAVLDRALALTEQAVECALRDVHEAFDGRHLQIEPFLFANYETVRRHIPDPEGVSRARQLLIGAMFSGEYALESAAIFNPSIVPHPDQRKAPAGGMRFIMSLRATGEGHISSIEFRAGSIASDGWIELDTVSRFVSAPHIVPNPGYIKSRFSTKLHEMGEDDEIVAAVMAPLEDRFTRSQLKDSMAAVRNDAQPSVGDRHRTLERMQWLADSNYELHFAETLAVSERIIFPVSPNEINGIEDARFVRFRDDDGSITYFATYTAYNGRSILPQLLETQDFLDFRVQTLSGSGIQNKGMALFPRRIAGRYAMLSRQDDENIFIMFSDSPYRWSGPEVLLRPVELWESVKIGNCGSPIETEAGWLVITHGVGPMRKYCIGAALLDLDDPTKVIGRLREPLLSPEGNERDGYVPNVVYSCGSMLFGRELILPYAVSDRASAIASVCLDDLLAAMLA